MAAKLLHSLADDNPDLQKQIGCMTGIFQIFDRQHFLSGRRPNQRRLLPAPSGNSKSSNESIDSDSSNNHNREALEKTSNKYLNEKRASTESSRASFSSSSRSSSFSSLDCGRTGQPEPSSMDRICFPDTPSRDPIMSQTSASPSMGRLCVDLRDVVKDSMYRDSRGFSVRTMIKEEASGHILKHKDSPRPLHLSKSVSGLSGVGIKEKQDVAADLKESLRVLARFHDAPQYYNEKEPRLSFESKEDSSFSVKDAPRFSYDGRDVHRKIKDLPRLSLDSRENSARNSIIDSKFNHLSGSMNGDGKCSNERVANQLQPSRPSSVVAKLMGLDMLPDTKPSSEAHLGPLKTFSVENSSPSSISLRTRDVCRSVRLPKSPRSLRKEPNSPRWKNPDAVMKPVSSSKIPIEPAPWKHMDSARTSPKQASRKIKSSTSTSSTSSSVYGEIEKRLKDIEFKQSGKDLRALKQILEAIQAKGFLEGTKEQQSSNIAYNRDNDKKFGYGMVGQVNSSDPHATRAFSSKLRGSSRSTALESPIVIMKPAKVVQKSNIHASSIIPIDSLPGLQGPHAGEAAAHGKNSAISNVSKDQTVKDSRNDQATTSGDKKTNNRFLRVAQTSSRPSQMAKDNTTNLLKNSASTSPRLQQKKLELDKRSRPPIPSPDSNKSRRQPNRQSNESGSPGGKRRPKPSSVALQGEGLNGKCNESRSVSLQEDSSSVHSDTCLPSESRIEIEATSTKQPLEIASCQSPSPEVFKCFTSKTTKSDANLRLSEENIAGDLAIAPEQPSPISVLDSSAYMEGSPSPVKQTSHTLQGAGDAITESNDIPGEDFLNTVDISTDSMVLKLPSEINRKKLQSINNLVQKLRRLNSTHDEDQTDYIASLCENTNPDHRYISEILLASGLLLRDLSSGLTAFQLHPSGLPINPELFFVLEQTKASGLLAKGVNNVNDIGFTKSKPEKFHRKLIFDAVNEILAGKLALVGPPAEPWLKPDKLAKKTVNAQQLLKELCAEIELFQTKKQDFSLEEEQDGLKTILWEDVMHRSDNWTNFQGEVSGIILDVERSIFKELVNEIVIGEAAGHRGRPNMRCRQLFSK